MKKVFLTSVALLLAVACAKPAKHSIPTTLRLRAEQAKCGLDESLFAAPPKAIALNNTAFDNLKANKINDSDSDDVKKAKEKVNGTYSLKEAVIFKYVYGKESADSVFTDGSTRIKFDTTNGWQQNSLSTSPVCDTLNTASDNTHTKPGPGQFVAINESGVESFDIPSLKVQSMFSSSNDQVSQKPTTSSDLSDMQPPGDQIDKIAQAKISIQYYLLEDGSYLSIVVTERPTSITVLRATYSKPAPTTQQ